MNREVRQLIAGLMVSGAITLSFSGVAQAEGRKKKSEVKPTYPEMARQMKLSGAVNLELDVAPDGTVKNVKVLGGHPLLVKAAVTAAKQWRYEPAPSETSESVEFKFNGVESQ